MKAVILSTIAISLMSSWAQAQTLKLVQSPVGLQPKLELQKLKPVRLESDLQSIQLKLQRRDQLKLNVRKGNEGGGGGDPTQLGHVANGIRTELERQKRNGQALELTRKRQQEIQALLHTALQTYVAAKYLRYPITNVDEVMLGTLSLEIKIELAAPLFLNNSAGKRTRVTFISDPSTKVMKVDYALYLSFAKSSLHKPERYGDLIATLFHELLVMSRIEPSMTYTKSAALSQFVANPKEADGWYLGDSLAKMSTEELAMVGLAKEQLNFSWPRTVAMPKGKVYEWMMDGNEFEDGASFAGLELPYVLNRVMEEFYGRPR